MYKSTETQKSCHKTSPLRKPLSLGETKTAGCTTVTAFPGNWMWCTLLNPFSLLLSSLAPNLESWTDRDGYLGLSDAWRAPAEIIMPENYETDTFSQ